LNDYLKSSNSINESQLVCAAAGTGKTKVLVDRYLNILRSRQAGIEQIIAITFTEKAANEMKSRIRDRLNKNSLGFSHNEKVKLVDKINTAPISTVHSFCGRLLHENISLLDIDPLFRIVDEVEELVLRNDFTEKFLNERLKSNNADLLHLLEFADLSVVKNILNVAWSKQSECLICFNEIADNSISVLANSLKDRHEKLTLKQLSGFFDHPIIRDSIRKIKILPRVNSTDTLQKAIDVIIEADSLVKNGTIPDLLWDRSLRDALSGRKKGSKKFWGDIVDEARSYHSELYIRWKEIKDDFILFNAEIELSHIKLLKSYYSLVSEFVELYRKELYVSGLIDFGGLEIEAEKFLESRSDEARKYLSKFKHLLVDEFQDINPIQNRIIELIIELNPDIITFFVGDEKQSIYRFRGAEVEIFNKLRKQTKLLRLNQNFRSVEPLMHFYNWFFRYFLGESEPEFNFDVNYPVPIEPFFRGNLPYTPVEFLIVKEEDNEEQPNSIQGFSSIMAEVTFVVSRISELHSELIVKIRDEELRAAEWKDMAILLRSRTHQSLFESILQKAGIPFYATTGIGFYNRREVQDVINFLRVLLNFHDEVSLVGTLRSPMFGVSDITLLKLTTDNGLFDGLRKYFIGEKSIRDKVSKDERTQLDHFYEVYQKLDKTMLHLSTAELIQEILEETNYLPVIASFGDGSQRVANVLKLIDLAVEWSSLNDISPIDFIRRIQIYRSMEVREGEANLSSEKGNCVTIMTVHGSKGLDFPIVFIPRLSAKINYNKSRILFHPGEGIALSMKTLFKQEESFMYNHLKRQDKFRTFAEEKRLLYVAATRAQSYLVFSADDTKRKKGSEYGSLWSQISSFLSNSEENTLYKKKEKTRSELYDVFSKMKGNENKVVEKLTDEQRENILKMVAPIEIKPALEKITPTAFAEWVGEKFIIERKSYKGVQASGSKGNENEDLLTPLELGSIIHKAFSWWDFNNIDLFKEKIAELLAPFYLDENEKELILVQLESWANMILTPENALNKLILDSVEMSREVEVIGRLDDVLIEGKIDLLIKDSEGNYTIIDFKSDKLDDFPYKTLLEKYRAQLNLYSLVLIKWSKLPVVQHCIYFVRNGLMVSTPISEDIIEKVECQLREFKSAMMSGLPE